MKKILCALLASVLLTGCFNMQEPKKIPSGRSEALAETLSDGISAFLDEVCLDAADEPELADTFARLYIEQPSWFFLTGNYRYTVRGRALLFYPEYRMDRKTAAEYTRQLEAAADRLLTGISAELCTADTALLLHDRLLRQVSYDQKKETPLPDALLAGYADCEGYARAYQYLLHRAGIDALYVTGEAGGGHAWVMFSDECGVWYHADPAWDDGDGFVSRAYFMQSDAAFAGTHTIRPLSSGVHYPACTGKPYRFFSEKRLCADSSDDLNAMVRRAFDEAFAAETNAAELCFPDGVSLAEMSALDTAVLAEAKRRAVSVDRRIVSKTSCVVTYRIAG